MTDDHRDGFEGLADQHRLGNCEPPEVVQLFAAAGSIELLWRNELGGLTFRAGDVVVKWNPRSTGIDLDAERVRLAWLGDRHPVPTVVDHGEDETAQWIVTVPMAGESAVGDRWRARRAEAVTAIAVGLRALHALPVDDVPPLWTDEAWPTRTPPSLGPRPPIERPVVVHGDACAPNTLIDASGRWVGHVDVGDLSVGDRWADLAIAAMSLDWNFGEGHQHELYDAYGIDADPERIAWYRALWDLES